jgi:hypothetical protein
METWHKKLRYAETGRGDKRSKCNKRTQILPHGLVQHLRESGLESKLPNMFSWTGFKPISAGGLNS